MERNFSRSLLILGLYCYCLRFGLRFGESDNQHLIRLRGRFPLFLLGLCHLGLFLAFRLCGFRLQGGGVRFLFDDFCGCFGVLSVFVVCSVFFALVSAFAFFSASFSPAINSSNRAFCLPYSSL